MTRKDYVKICSGCIHRSFHCAIGTICGLTSESPEFTGHCPDYDGDSPLLQSIQEKETRLLDQKKGIWRDLGHAFLGLLLLMLGSITFRGALIKKGGDLIKRTLK